MTPDADLNAVADAYRRAYFAAGRRDYPGRVEAERVYAELHPEAVGPGFSLRVAQIIHEASVKGLLKERPR
jgi:hypothetical protein